MVHRFDSKTAYENRLSGRAPKKGAFLNGVGRDQPTPNLYPTKTHTNASTLQPCNNTTTACDQDQPNTTPNLNQYHRENTAAMHQHQHSQQPRPTQLHTQPKPTPLHRHYSYAPTPPQLATKTNPRATLYLAHPPAHTVVQQHRQRATTKPTLNKCLPITVQMRRRNIVGKLPLKCREGRRVAQMLRKRYADVMPSHPPYR